MSPSVVPPHEDTFGELLPAQCPHVLNLCAYSESRTRVKSGQLIRIQATLSTAAAMVETFVVLPVARLTSEGRPQIAKVLARLLVIFGILLL